MQNPFSQALATQPLATNSQIESQREIAEVQASYIMARTNPRNVRKAISDLMDACTRPGLANVSLYSYPRGKDAATGMPNIVTGATIRLAEQIARNYGNIQSGYNVLDQNEKGSIVHTYAIDLENINRKDIKFPVSHVRYTKNGSYMLTDARDIYEAVANQASRRVRACILSLVPFDMVEDAINQCEVTMRATATVSTETITKLIDAFKKLDISKEQIENYLKNKIEDINNNQVVDLKKIYTSIRDGYSAPSVWFETVSKNEGSADQKNMTTSEKIMDRFAKKSNMEDKTITENPL